MQAAAESLRLQGKRIALVPTMGFLHEGHLSLIRLARQHADVVVTSIFVNPAQFAPTEDFSKYPRDLTRDKSLAESAGTGCLFTPSTDEIYPSPFLTYVTVEEITSRLEGKFRPTHFRGVATVVAKLFNIVKPHVAVFGQKDAQQAAVIRQLARDLNFDLRVIIGPIVREPDGLAMSSRNVYLSASERAESVVLCQSLQRAKELVSGGQRQSSAILSEMTKMISSKKSAAIDYISIADASTLEEVSLLTPGPEILVSLAVKFGSTRLIDNILLTV